jgi:hypothetical protein
MLLRAPDDAGWHQHASSCRSGWRCVSRRRQIQRRVSGASAVGRRALFCMRRCVGRDLTLWTQRLPPPHPRYCQRVRKWFVMFNLPKSPIGRVRSLLILSDLKYTQHSLLIRYFDFEGRQIRQEFVHRNADRAGPRRNSLRQHYNMWIPWNGALRTSSSSAILL